jgi:hypothetical protein
MGTRTSLSGGAEALISIEQESPAQPRGHGASAKVGWGSLGGGNADPSGELIKSGSHETHRWRETASNSILEWQVVGRPATSMISLIPTGTPCNGPRRRPAAVAPDPFAQPALWNTGADLVDYARAIRLCAMGCPMLPTPRYPASGGAFDVFYDGGQVFLRRALVHRVLEYEPRGLADPHRHTELSLYPSRKLRANLTNVSGACKCGKCPASTITSNRAPGISAAT